MARKSYKASKRKRNPPYKIASAEEEIDYSNWSLEDLTKEVESLGANPYMEGKRALHVGSSWIAWIMYFPETQELMVKFIRGKFPCLYAGVNPQTALTFSRAPSKGEWFYHRSGLYGPNYKLVTSSYRPGRKSK